MIEKISYDHVNEIASKMETISQTMKEICDSTNQEMKVINSGSGVYDSNAASQLKQKYDVLSSKFESFYNAVRQYSTFLRNTVATYKAADAAIAKKAQESLN